MFRKNTSGQFIHFQGVDSSTGGIKSGVSWTVRRCIDGTFAAATGTATEDGTTGWYKFALSQADTNGNNIGFNFTGTGAVPQTVNIITTALDPTSTAFGLSIAKTTNITGFNDIAATAVVSSGAITTSGGAVSTVTNTTQLNGAATVVLTDASSDAVIADAVWNAATATYGSAGSYGLLVETDLDATISSRMATYTQPSGFLAATFPSGTVASTTNITGGTITTATNLTTNNDKTGYSLTQTFPTNFADLAITVTTGRVTVGTNADKTGYSISGTKTTLDALNDIAATAIVSAGAITTSAGKVSGVILADTVTTYTGNTPQTGDTFALANGASGFVATKADTAAILTDTGTTLDTALATVDTVVDAIKVQTDKMVFTVANQLDANIQSVNDVTVTGTGAVGDEWGP